MPAAGKRNPSLGSGNYAKLDSTDDSVPSTRLPQPPLSGGCQCGACRYTITRAPHSLYVCHCLSCQQQSASAHGISLIVPLSGFKMSPATPADAIKIFTRPTDTGRLLDCHFCSACGVRLWHSSEDKDGPKKGGALISVKGGTLDPESKSGLDLASAVHIWVKRKMRGVEIPPGAKCYDEEPPDDEDDDDEALEQDEEDEDSEEEDDDAK